MSLTSYKAGFLNLGTSPSDTLGQVVLCCGAVTCIVEQLAAFLYSMDQTPLAFSALAMTTKNASGYCQISPGASITWVRSIAVRVP